tara:strand:+ start:51 stop:377 length:327 start_codon:yes stop_codon:yes gene_type:complete
MTIKPPPQQCKNEEMGFTLHHRVELVEQQGHQFLPRIASTAGKSIAAENLYPQCIFHYQVVESESRVQLQKRNKLVEEEERGLVFAAFATDPDECELVPLDASRNRCP